jgi:hypothetical protein
MGGGIKTITKGKKMKLFLLSNRALLLQGKNRAKVCVIHDGKVLETDGLLQIGGASVSISGGYGAIPPLSCGNLRVTFVDASGKTYDGGVVCIERDGSIKNNSNAIDAVLTEATKIDAITKEIAKLQDDITEIKGRIEYSGLDFMLKGE